MDVNVLSRNALSSVAQVVFSALALFALYRILTHYLTMSQVGLWSLVVASTSVARLSDFGLGAGVVRFVANDLGRGDRRRAAQTVLMTLALVGPLVSVAAIGLYPVFLSALTHALPADQLADGVALLPFAVASLVVGTLGNIFLGTLDGCQRSDSRALIQFGASLFQLAAGIWLVPAGGIRSLGPIQLMQSTFVLVVGAAVAAHLIEVPISSWFSWDRARIGELLRYGGGMQISAVGQLLFDPTVKLLLTIFGGLSLTGYYELANRMMLQFRSVIVSAFYALVPFIAGRLSNEGLDSSDIRRIYLRTFHLLLAIAVPYYSVVGASLPLALTVWIGHFEPQFLTIAIFSLLGWSANTVVGPAHFLYQAVGRLRWTIWTQLSIGLLNLCLAWVGGRAFGGIGVLAGSTFALILGSAVTVVGFHYDYRVRVRELFPSEAASLYFTSFAGMTVCLLLSYNFKSHALFSVWMLIGPAALMIATVPLFWRQQVRVDLLARHSLGRH